MQELQRIKTKDEAGNTVEEKKEETEDDSAALCNERIRRIGILNNTHNYTHNYITMHITIHITIHITKHITIQPIHTHYTHVHITIQPIHIYIHITTVKCDALGFLVRALGGSVQTQEAAARALRQICRYYTYTQLYNLYIYT
jgi:hypothetical protein